MISIGQNVPNHCASLDLHLTSPVTGHRTCQTDQSRYLGGLISHNGGADTQAADRDKVRRVDVVHRDPRGLYPYRSEFYGCCS